MGTVGLNFGSPFSGQGFDVSTTVSEIMANIQGVETPWKSQITTLDSQDTVLSSLGTLLSNLSTDMTSLTDASGILAQKTGSSSDSNVLELTAADNSAIAGTHVVTVSNLAATSSGVLTELPSATTPLTGSIVIQVGASGTALTVALTSSDNTLTGLASAINSAGIGVSASVLTDTTGSRLSIVSGTSGVPGDLNITSHIATAIGYADAGTSSLTVDSGTLGTVASTGDTLSGSVVLQVGTAAAQTITLSSNNSLTGLETAINSANLGVTASIVTNGTTGVSSIKLLSQTGGTAGALTVTSNLTDTTPSTPTALSYADAGNVSLAADTGTLGSVLSTSNKLSGSVVLKVGSGTPQTITLSSPTNNLTGLETAINAANLGVTASIVTSGGLSSIALQSQTNGAAGALTVTSSLTDTTLLGYTSAVPGANASLTVDGVSLTTSSNTVNNLIPGVTFQLLATSAANSPVQVVVGNYNSGVESTVNSLVTDYNSLMSAINTQEGKDSSGNSEPLFGSPTLSMLQQDILGGIVTNNPNGYLDGISTNVNTTISGSIVIQVGTAAAQTITLKSSQNTVSALAAAINSANIGVTAGMVTTDGESSLTLVSETAGANGALTVTSGIVAHNPAKIIYTDQGNGGASGLNDTGTIGSVPLAADKLAGSVLIQVGTAGYQTITLSSNNTLQGLSNAITAANIGVTADVVAGTDGSSSYIQLTSQTPGTAGAITVSSSLTDISNKVGTVANYNFSSDITSMSMLGVSVNSDGTLSLDVASLDSVLNTDYSGVQGLFQNANSWGTSFATMLNNAGTSSSTGILKLSQNSNSSIESTLNADISREDLLISSESKSVLSELNSANEIMQELPQQLSGVNELYSAISGYNQSST
jgi:flagellar hook-associated protein 2